MKTSANYVRVKQYKAEYPNGYTALLNFTELQAQQVGGIIEKDGLAINKAIELVKLWNLQGKRGGYIYSIPFVNTEKTKG